MTQQIKLGILTPSSNTTLEPLTYEIISSIQGVSAHFSRFTVTEITMDDKALSQFDDDHILQAAELLAHAKVDVIGWSGTSASWLGFDTDEKLCERIHQRTGIPATTSVLALNELIRKNNIKNLGLVTPYLKNVQEKIIANYAQIGVKVNAEAHLNLQDNYSFSQVSEEKIKELIDEVGKRKPDAITTLCTNLKGTRLAQLVEQELDIPLYDSVATVIWKALKIAGYDTQQVKGWGRMFQTG